MLFEARATRVPSRYSVKLPPSKPKRLLAPRGRPKTCHVPAASSALFAPAPRAARPVRGSLPGPADEKERGVWRRWGFESILIRIVSAACFGEKLAGRHPAGWQLTSKTKRLEPVALHGIGKNMPPCHIESPARIASCAQVTYVRPPPARPRGRSREAT